MKTIKGPAIFLAQFAGDAAPFNSLDAICGWAAGLGYKGVQIPSWDGRLFDLEKAAGTAGAGLREDPTDLDSLDYLIDILRGTRTTATHAQYKAILDRWMGADSKPVVPAEAPRGPRR